MSFSLIYLFHRGSYRLWEFFKHWYTNSFFIISHKTLNFLELLDRNFALKITARNWLKPLYQDYTVLGHILGFSFRTLRIIAASLVYIVIIIIAAALYLIWAAFPVYIIYRGFIKP